MPAPPPDAPPGFVIEREVGRGGMGVVYLARQTGLNRPVALKLVQAGDAGSALRFLAEAEAMAAVRHPHVVEVYQFGEHAGRPFLALEHCPGGDLTATFRAGKLPPTAAAELLAAVAEGVAAAHALGIVHRDLKPHNVLLAADGSPKVTDFGLAKRAGGSDLTRTDAVMGTPAYMPPEQAKGATKFAGPPADVWALGVMLYEALTGTRPFAGADHWAVLAAVQRGAFAAPRAVVPDAPRDLELICLKCLKPEPHERYPTAAELAADLRNWREGRPIAARPAGVVEQAVKWARRNKKLAGMGAAVLLTMATATAVSVGFGLAADGQRKTADLKTHEVATALSELASANGKLSTTLLDLERSNERTNRALAKALLGPISVKDDRLGEYERASLWELTALREEPMGMVFLDEATRTPLTAAQFRHRVAWLDHAAVGLDSRKRRQADDLFAARLRDVKLPADWRRDVAMAVADAERITETGPLTQALFASLSKSTDFQEWQVIMRGLGAVAGRVPAGHRAAACGEAAEMFAARWGTTPDEQQRLLAMGLAAVAEGLPADKTSEVCGRSAGLLLTALGTTSSAEHQQILARCLVAVSAGRPAEGAAESLVAALEKSADADARLQLARGLAAVTTRLPGERGAAACGRAAELLLTALEGVTGVTERPKLVAGLAAVAGRLSAEVCWKAAETLTAALEKETDGFQRQQLVKSLAAAAGGLSPERAAWVCRQAALLLLAALRAEPNEFEERLRLAKGVAALAARLPAGDASTVCVSAARMLMAAMETSKGVSEQGLLAQALAAVAGGLPADRRADTCRKAYVVLLTAVRTMTDGSEERLRLAQGMVAVASRLPAADAAGMYGVAAELLAAGLGKPRRAGERWALAEGLAEVATRLPAKTATDRQHRALDEMMACLGEFGDRDWAAVASGLVTAATGLRESDRIHHTQRVELAALAGGVTLHPVALPQPRPLPPQRLVELLKHPFCVKEARRAVLDALEVTYDRRFADLWAFVAFAEQEHPELDLLTPPKRPEKK